MRRPPHDRDSRRIVPWVMNCSARVNVVKTHDIGSTVDVRSKTARAVPDGHTVATHKSFRIRSPIVCRRY